MSRKDGDANFAKRTRATTFLSEKFQQKFAATVSTNLTKSLSFTAVASLEIEFERFGPALDLDAQPHWKGVSNEKSAKSGNILKIFLSESISRNFAIHQYGFGFRWFKSTILLWPNIIRDQEGTRIQGDAIRSALKN